MVFRQNTLADCEARIEQGLATFIDVGTALLTIRDERLYRENHTTFESYCRARWDFTRAYAYRLIDAAQITRNLSPNRRQTPESEWQARPLVGLEPIF